MHCTSRAGSSHGKSLTKGQISIGVFPTIFEGFQQVSKNIEKTFKSPVQGLLKQPLKHLEIVF